jgi:hypothetical protein
MNVLKLCIWAVLFGEAHNTFNPNVNMLERKFLEVSFDLKSLS